MTNMTDNAKKLYLYLAENPGFHSPTALAKAIWPGTNRHSAFTSPILQSMAKQRLVERNHRGQYKLADGNLYRAVCGLEKSTPLSSTPTMNLLMGWIGDSKAETEKLRTDKEPPDPCKTCRHLVRRIDFVWPQEKVEGMAAVVFLECPTFALVGEEVQSQ